MKKILRFDTRGGNELPLANYVKDELNEMGFKTKMFRHGSNRASLLAWTGSINEQKLCFNCHTDVVPYVKNYFYEKNERFYAPGAVDTKKDIAPQLAAIKKIKNVPDGLVLAYDADEEYNNIGILKMKKYIKANKIVVNEPTNMEVHTGARGWAQVDVTSQGKQCHSNNAKGYNAPENLVFFMNDLIKFGFKKNDNKLGKSSLAIQHYLTGSKEDVRVEGEANLFFTLAHNRNYDSPTKIKSEINRIIKKSKVKNLNYKITDFDGTFTNFNSQLGKYMVNNFNLKTGYFPGWCNSHIFKERDTIIFGMGNPELCHTDNEYVTKNQIIKSQKIYENMINNLC